MFKTCRLAMTGLLASAALTVPAHASTLFDFRFTAPLTGFMGLPTGDTASGAGTLTTEDADANGFYRFRSATGSFAPYAGGDPRTISNVAGINGKFDIGAGGLYKDIAGNFVTDGAVFYNEFAFDGIGFFDRTNAAYNGFFSEVGISGAALTFTPAVTAAVPEPATWAMMVFGFGALGVAMRRHRKIRVRFA